MLLFLGKGLLCVIVIGLLPSLTVANEDELYEEIDQVALYQEAIQSIAANPNKQGLRKAAALLKKVARAGLPEAQYALGSLYLHGQGVRRNRSIAAKWFEQSARQGFRAAMYHLAVSNLTGGGVEQNQAEAKRLFSEIVNPGEDPQIRVEDFRWQRAIRAESSYFLASILMEEKGESGDESTDSDIVNLMRSAAQGGSANATMFLALERAKGILLERDLDLTKKYLDDYHLIMSDSLRRSLDQFFIDGIDQAIARDLERGSEEVDDALYQEIYAQIYFVSKEWLDQPAEERDVSSSSIVELLTIAADGGYPSAQLELGLLYARGEEIPADHAKALDLLSKASETIPRVAVFNRAVMLRIGGDGIERDEALSRSLFMRAKSVGLYAAAAILDGDLEARFMTEKELRELCIEQRGAKDPNALYSYTFRQEYGIGIEQEENSKQLFRRYLDAAKEGSVQAMAEVGNRYFYGDGVKQSCQKSIQWLERAEEHGDPNALFLLGFMYDSGECFEENDRLSVEYYRKSADLENANAMNNLAASYFYDDAFKDKSGEAILLWEKAAETGVAIAMRNLGSAYLQGKLVEQDSERAIENYTKAANLGDLPAILELARIYRTGDGVEVDIEEESYWIERSAEQRIHDSMSTMAFRFYRGYGVPKSNFKAMMWANQYLVERGNVRGSISSTSLKLYLMVADLMATPGWAGYDPDEAIKLYNRIKDINRGEVSYELAQHYKKGSLGEENKPKAFGIYMNIVREYGPAYKLYGKCAYEISICYRDGIGTKKSHEKWMDWLGNAARANNPSAVFDLAIARIEGNGIEKDKSEGVRLMVRASTMKLRKAHFWLSEYYLQNEPNSDEATKALKYLQGLAVGGNLKARSLLRKLDRPWNGGDPNKEGDDSQNPSEEKDLFKPVKPA